jgi:hypothetical protein
MLLIHVWTQYHLLIEHKIEILKRREITLIDADTRISIILWNEQVKLIELILKISFCFFWNFKYKILMKKELVDNKSVVVFRCIQLVIYNNNNSKKENYNI